MSDPIRRLLARVSLFVKPRGRHRRVGLPPLRACELPAQPEIPLPAHRSPYGLHGPLDGAATVAVRPYLLMEVA
ncbi:hypothetical protein SUDANB105_03507 [Streptomyces sp. enrichment culture]|uniref:hypothetical protein n=1 Tax=Streptomyces sp. enrichment culture TaxID=1795815 RepID=UPI003F54CF9C